MADFALAIDVPHRLRQCLQDIRPLASERVVQLVGGDEVGLAPFQRTGDAEQAHNVGVVRVEILPMDGRHTHVSQVKCTPAMILLPRESPTLPCIGPVHPDFVNLLGILAEVLDMSQNVALAVLTDEVAQVRPQSLS